NLHQVEALIRLAESLGAERIELANTQFYGWALHNRAALMPTKAQLDEAWRVVQRERARLGTRLEIVWVLPDYHEQYPKPCMGGWARAYMTVTPAGEVWPCHAFLVAGDAALTDPVCSLSPHRDLIDAAVAEVERAAEAAEWTYRAAPASRVLAAKG